IAFLVYNQKVALAIAVQIMLQHEHGIVADSVVFGGRESSIALAEEDREARAVEGRQILGAAGVEVTRSKIVALKRERRAACDKVPFAIAEKYLVVGIGVAIYITNVVCAAVRNVQQSDAVEISNGRRIGGPIAGKEAQACGGGECERVSRAAEKHRNRGLVGSVLVPVF